MYCSSACRPRACEDRSRRADTLQIVELEAEVERLREELTQLQAADPSGSDRASERAERPVSTAGLRRPGRAGGPQQTWLLLQGEED